MKQVTIIVLLYFFAFSGSAQPSAGSKMSPWLRHAVHRQHQMSHRAADNEDVLTTIFVQMSETINDDVLLKYGCRKYAQVNDIAIVTIPLNQVEALTAEATVLRVEANEMAHTTMDTVPRIVNILPAYKTTDQHQAFTGAGVVVGVMDVGIDLTHPTFYDNASLSNYRINAFWDQLSTDTIDSPFPVGREWRGATEILAQGCSVDGHEQNHGTHTTGIAAGSGYDSPYRGVAYGSELCLVANAVSEDTVFIDKKDIYKYTSATDALGFKYLFDYAEEQGKPCVVSFSEGYPPYFDEDDLLYAKFLKGLTGPGRILVVSAGNENIELTRAVKPRGEASAGAFVRSFRKQASYCIKTDGPLTISLYGYRKDNYQQVHELHFDSHTEWPDETLSDTLLIGEDSCAVAISRYPSQFSEHIIYQLELSSDKILDQIGFIAIAMEGADCQSEILGSSTSALANHTIDMRWQAATKGSNILAPGCFEAAICVGSTTHRLSFTNIDGNERKTFNDEIGKVSFFSSRGPTISGHTKPDVTAPGMNIISSLSSYYLEENPSSTYWDVSHFDTNGRTYVWGANIGTSMSAPVVAGTIALWLQANPQLTREDIMGIFQRTCRLPDTTLPYPNNDYGYGEIDAYRGLLDILGLTGIKELSQHQLTDVQIRVDEGQLLLSLPHALVTPLTLSLYSTAGVQLLKTTIPAGNTCYTHPLPNLPYGVYAVQLTGGGLTGSQLIRK